jgi:hypothetical protein
MVNSSYSLPSDDNNAQDAQASRERCEDAPCCGCCPSAAEYYEPFVPHDLYDDNDYVEDMGEEDDDGAMTLAEADANALASAGWGTDEDYGYGYGGAEDGHLDSYWESQNECW